VEHHWWSGPTRLDAEGSPRKELVLIRYRKGIFLWISIVSSRGDGISTSGEHNQETAGSIADVIGSAGSSS
jgi:hypothetical protein